MITKKIDGVASEPFEEAIIEVPDEYVGDVIDLLGRRKGTMVDMSLGLGSIRVVKYKVPTRGLLGLRNLLMTTTKGTAVLHTIFLGYEPECGEITVRDNGSLTAHETGTATSYALENFQNRGSFIVKPGGEVYEGQVVGLHNRDSDLRVNVCKKKHLTNVRSANKDSTVVLEKVMELTLDECLEFIRADELVEVTPKSVRIRKMNLSKK